VFASIRSGLLELLAESNDAVDAFAHVVAPHTDPEALFMYAGVQAHFGDRERALARLTDAVERGFSVPQALREHPWLEPLRGGAVFAGLVERTEEESRLALAAFRDAGGEALLGPASG
jgi:hypothetical protein